MIRGAGDRSCVGTTLAALPAVNVVSVLVASVAIACGACSRGPNAAQIKEARGATYVCDADENWDALVVTVKARYPKAAVSETSRNLITMPRWYRADGSRWQGGIVHTNSDGSAQAGEKDPRLEHRYKVQLFISLEQDDERWQVVARPVVHELKPPLVEARVVSAQGVPAWVQERVDVVLVDYRRRNARCVAPGEL